MNYLHINPDAVICYHASDMILKIVSDAAFLVIPQEKSLSAAIYHLWYKENKKQNGILDLLFQKINNVVASASEDKICGVYLGARHGCPLWIACIKLGHPQPENGTPFKTDNSTAYGILASNMRGKTQNDSICATGG